jgi:hypothetical protein
MTEGKQKKKVRVPKGGKTPTKPMGVMDDFTHKINCDMNSCALRYYLDKNELAVGLVRFTHGIKEGKIPQRILSITSMDLNDMVGYIMLNYGFTLEQGEALVATIRSDAQQKVKVFLNAVDNNFLKFE